MNYNISMYHVAAPCVNTDTAASCSYCGNYYIVINTAECLVILTYDDYMWREILLL